eukprot:9610854-Ditylum_brightwellii.AAC.2
MLEGLKITGNKLVDDWIAKHHSEWKVQMVPVPRFTVSTGARKFGSGNNRVETIAVHIECAEADTMYLKVLLAKAYENEEHYGIFNSNKYHLTHGVDSYKQLLQRQNSYLKDIDVIAVEEITSEALVQDIIVERE